MDEYTKEQFRKSLKDQISSLKQNEEAFLDFISEERRSREFDRMMRSSKELCEKLERRLKSLD